MSPGPDQGVSQGTSHAELGDLLHAHGLRVTPQRRRVLAAVRALGHATVDDVAEHLAAEPGSDPVDTSTVYRSLDLLEEVGLVGRTQLDRRVPTFHPVEHGGHLHLICSECGRMTETTADVAAEMAAEVLLRNGFAVDTAHLALRGLCTDCRPADSSTLEGPL